MFMNKIKYLLLYPFPGSVFFDRSYKQICSSDNIDFHQTNVIRKIINCVQYLNYSTRGFALLRRAELAVVKKLIYRQLFYDCIVHRGFNKETTRRHGVMSVLFLKWLCLYTVVENDLYKFKPFYTR